MIFKMQDLAYKFHVTASLNCSTTGYLINDIMQEIARKIIARDRALVNDRTTIAWKVFTRRSDDARVQKESCSSQLRYGRALVVQGHRRP